MSTFLWIFLGGLLMSLIALSGSLTLLFKKETLERLILPLVALASGSLLGGAFFHMIPASIDALGNHISVYIALLTGFILFFILEQALHWHHCHQIKHNTTKKPLTYLILIADGLHNFIGGLGVAGAFLIDTRVGIAAWIAAAAHEIPQELGDFGVLIHGGWKKSSALLYNFLSGLSFLIGGLFAYSLSSKINISHLLPFAAGNFIYIAAADLIPEIKEKDIGKILLHLFFFLLGAGILMVIEFFQI